MFSLPVLSAVFFNSVGFFFVVCFMPLCFFFPSISPVHFTLCSFLSSI
ncbi:hypothetical protein CP8484711_2828, partial [Chlamydia psittaci 84-8471/1]